MADPFEALREAVEPIEPDPLFTAHLRARLARALALPKGVTVSDLTVDAQLDPPALETAKEGDLAYVSLWVPDGDRAASFFSAVLGWTVAGGTPDPGHARQVEGLSIPHGILGGCERSTLFLCFYVADMAGALKRVREAGGHADGAGAGGPVDCIDNQGARFALFELPGQRARGELNGRLPGDVAYLTLEVEDSAEARAFYGSVLGWRFTPGRVADGWQNDGVVPMVGLHGGNSQATVVPMYRVDDISGAVARVRAQGGTCSDPQQQGYGVTADCVDDQGTRFYLGQL